jgi:guanylate kinase
MIARRGTLIVVSAPSGAGKTTLCREVRLCLPDLAYSVSYTTRPPRPGEVDGRDFHFVTEPAFHAGTLERALADGRDILLDIDTQGARQLRARYPTAVLVFIIAPSMAELEQRLRERRSDPEREIRRRLDRAREEVPLWREYDYLIVNRDVKEATEHLAAVIQAERCRTNRLSLAMPDLEVRS